MSDVLPTPDSLDPHKFILAGNLDFKKTDEELKESRDWIYDDPLDPEDNFGNETSVIQNPKEPVYPDIIKYQDKLINTAEELMFLDGVPLKTPISETLEDLNKARELMTLLNTYEIGMGWSCNLVEGNTTAGFTLLYFGSVKEMPEEYKINPNGSLVAILELTTYSGPAVYSLVVG